MGIKSDNTILVLTHCETMPSSDFVDKKLRKLKKNNFNVQKSSVFYYTGSKESISDIEKCIRPGDGQYIYS